MRLPSNCLYFGIGERDQQHALPTAGRGVVVVPVGAGDAVVDFVLRAAAAASGPSAARSSPAMPPSCAHGGMMVARLFWPARYGYTLACTSWPWARACRDGRDQLRHLAPHLVLGDLEVDDVDGHCARAADLDRLRDGFEDAAAFGAHVRRVDAAVFARRPRTSRRACRYRSTIPEVRSANWRRRARPAPSPACTSSCIRLSSSARGRPGLLAVHVGPDLARSHVGADIGGYALLQQLREVAVEVDHRGLYLLLAAERRGRSAFAEDHRSDALADHALGVAVDQDGVVGVVVDVDEAGRDDESLGVDLFGCRSAQRGFQFRRFGLGARRCRPCARDCQCRRLIARRR